jgi:ubiquinone/menaquinone biosynthesis C-methylase UbiE
VHTAELLVPWITRHLSPGARVLDVAGGAGTFASQIVRATEVEVVGLDISESMVAQRREDPLLTSNVVGDMEALPFADASFDAAMFVACLHHVPDPVPALREAHRVLHEDGMLFVFEPSSLRARKAGTLPIEGELHEFRLSGARLAERIEAAGFEVEERRGARIAVRVLRRVAGPPSLPMLRRADTVDRVLRLLPGARDLAEVAMIRARPSSRPS